MNIEKLLKTKLESPVEEERVQAVRELAELDSNFTVTLLYQAMSDSGWRVRKEAATTFLALPHAGEFTGDIIEFLHSQNNAGLRNTAVEILIRLGRPVVPALLHELGSPDQDVRKFVLDILGDIGAPSSIPAMISAMTDPDRNVQAAAAENLGKLRAVEAVPALLDAMPDADLLMRFTILEALGKIGRPIAKEKILPYKKTPLLRKALFECVGRTSSEEGIPLLLEGLTDRMWNVREAALLALAGCLDSYPEAVREELATASPIVAAALSEQLQSDTPRVVRAAVRLISLLDDFRYAEPLLRLLGKEELEREIVESLIALGRPAVVLLFDKWSEVDARTKACLCFLAGEVHCSESVGQLLSALSATDPGLRMAAAQALGRLGESQAIPSLVVMLRETLPEVRMVAKKALCSLAAECQDEVVSAMRPLLEHDDSDIRTAAVSVMGRVDYEKLKYFVVLALKDESAEVRRAAVGVLGQGPDGQQLDVLKLALTDEDSEVRQAAARVLGTVNNKQALAALALALHDEDPWVRATAIRSIGRFENRCSVELIREAVGDPIGLVCIAALETLAVIASEEALPQLVAALYHEDEEVVDAALRQLVATGRRDWLESTTDRFINHPRREIRLHFARALETLAVSAYRGIIEKRLMVEREDLVRHHLESALDHCKR